MTNMRVITLGDISRFRYGKMPNSERLLRDDAIGGFPIFTGYRIAGRYPEFNLDEPHLIVVCRGVGGTGDVKISPPKCWLTNLSIVFDFIDESADIRYLFYFFSAYSLRFLDSGSAQSQITIADLRRLKILLPNLTVQKKIAAILSAYDDLIENNKRRIGLLEKMAEEIYCEWFVRFRFPGHEQVKMVKGVPEGWAQKRFGDFCMLQRGYDLPDKQVVSGPYPVVASTSIKTHHNQFKVKPPVITTGRSGSLGTVQYISENAWPLNTCLYVRNFYGNSSYLVYYTLKNMGLENFNAGAGVPSLNRNHINGISILIPSKPLQKQFDSIIAPLFHQKERLAQGNTVLEKTRDLLLPRLISGKLPVENLNIHFPPGMEEAVHEG